MNREKVTNHPGYIMASLAVAILICIFSGCASMQKITVTSEPPGASVFVKNSKVAITPAEIKVKRKEEYVVVRLEKEGYEPMEIALSRKIDGWYVPKLLLATTAGASASLLQHGGTRSGATAAGIGVAAGSTAGLIAGFGSGTAYKLHPAEVNVVLEELDR